MLDLERTKQLNDGITELLTETFGEQVPQFVFILPELGAMVSSIDDPYAIASVTTGVAYSLLSGNHTRRIHNVETGEEVKSN